MIIIDLIKVSLSQMNYNPFHSSAIIRYIHACNSMKQAVIHTFVYHYYNCFFSINISYCLHELCRPVQAKNKRSVEADENAEVSIVPYPDREGQKHDSNHKDVGDAIKENHSVYQVDFLYNGNDLCLLNTPASIKKLLRLK